MSDEQDFNSTEGIDSVMLADGSEQSVGVKACQCFAILDHVDDAGEPVYSQCDGIVMGKGSKFAPGHDAKLKSVLIKLYRAGQGYNYLSGSMLITSSPMIEAGKFGWERFLTAETKRKAKSPKAPVVELDVVSELQQRLDMTGAVNGVTVKVGRWWQAVEKVLSLSTEAVQVVYVTKKGDEIEHTVKPDKVNIRFAN